MTPSRRTVTCSAVLLLALSACGQEPAPSRSAAPPAPPSAAAPPSTAPPSTAPPSTAASPTQAPEGPARCTTQELSVTAGQPVADASSRTLVLELDNTSDRTCTITGFGGVGLLDDAGRLLPTRFVRGPGTPATVELAPGGFSTRTLSWRVVPAGPGESEADCVSAAALVVTPPDEEPGDLVVREPITACSGGELVGTPWGRDAG